MKRHFPSIAIIAFLLVSSFSAGRETNIPSPSVRPPAPKKRAAFADVLGAGVAIFPEKDEAPSSRSARLLAQARRGYTRECLAGLLKELEEARRRASETQTAAQIDALDKRLRAYESGFESLRQKLNDEPESIAERAGDLHQLVFEIHSLKMDSPLLFVKRHPYFAAHIYDDYLTWHPGGGIYILENPTAPIRKQVIRPIIDPTTSETLGSGVYRDPDISYDGKRVLFAFKGEAQGDTCIYEIGIDGKGLRRLTNPGFDCRYRKDPPGLIGKGQHDISPSYLPNGRIVFSSTRTGAQVMCFSSYIDILHTMNADGGDMRCISVNNQNEFDPTVLPDGRILYGRWEYVDKTALYMQSLWTMNPDGSGETALFKNNMAKPTAVLDARPVPDSRLIVASLTPHNGQSVGAIAMIDPHVGKNSLDAITNFTPEYPTAMDQGLARGPCDPWPLSADVVLIANNAESHGKHGVIEMIDRFGFRTVICRAPDISCFSPMPLRTHAAPPARPSVIQPGEPAKFFVHDIYQGMPGVKRGEVKRLRVLETTARLSGLPKGGRWWNQAFLVSWQGSYDIKNVLGVVPVEEDGSVFFEAPSGRALYFQALDANGRMVQSQRTFVQAVPGVTRSCVGCHIREDDEAPRNLASRDAAMRKEAVKIRPESWGSGLIDYPTMIQPILDRHCIRCHGGADGIADGIDLTGGWTWAFNISYESLLKNTLTGFLNCNNGSVRTAEILPPRTHGSGAAPLAEALVTGHKGRICSMTRPEMDLMLAWMDGNCNYYGAFDYSEHATCNALLDLEKPLLTEMERGGCLSCHAGAIGNDWVNLERPELSRILRAPMGKGGNGLGLGLCRARKAQRINCPLVTQRVQPPDVFHSRKDAPSDLQGAPPTPMTDAQSSVAEAMLEIIQRGRAEALKAPRVDMPGAIIVYGEYRQLPPLAPPLADARVTGQ